MSGLKFKGQSFWMDGIVCRIRGFRLFWGFVCMARTWVLAGYRVEVDAPTKYSILWGVKGDALSTFSASTWGLILPKAVRSASSWGFVVGLKHGTGCE